MIKINITDNLILVRTTKTLKQTSDLKAILNRSVCKPTALS